MEAQREAELIQQIETLERELEACHARETEMDRVLQTSVAPEKVGSSLEFSHTETEQQSRALSDEEGDPIWLIDLKDGSIAYHDEEGLRSYGYSHDDLAELKINGIDVKDDLEDTKDRLTQLVKKGSVLFETLHRKRSGEIRNIELNLRHITIGERSYNLGVVRDVTEHRQVEKERTKLLHELNERMKELSCLYDISRFASKQGISLEEILNETLSLLPPAFQFPEITCVRIILNGQEYKTDNFLETPSAVKTTIIVNGEKTGEVEVGYVEERPEADEGPFLDEEKLLLVTIASQLGRVAERMQIREELEASEARFKAQYAGIPIPTYTWQRQADDIVLLDYNDAAAKETQGKIADFVGFSAQEMYPHRPDFQEDMARCIDEGCSIERETIYEYMTTGDTKNLALKYGFVPPDLVLVQTEDITERVRAQEEAAYERDLMNTLLEFTPDYIYFKDRERRFVRVSNSFSDLFKLDLEEILGKRDEDLFPPEITEETVRDDKHVIETGTPLINKEEGGEPIGGVVPWVLTSKLPWYDKEGEILGLFGISREITERVRAQEGIASERELTQSILDTSLDTVAVLDAQTLQYVKWNKALTRITGYSDEEVATLHPIEDFYDEEEGIRVQATVEELMMEGKVTTTVTHINKDGSRLPLDYTGAIIKNDEGDPQYFVFIGRDISERLEAEEKLQATEVKYRNLVENINEVIYSLTTEGIVTYVSPAIESVLGIAPNDLIGSSFDKFILPEDLEKARENIAGIMKGELLGMAEYRAKDTSGDVHWIRVSSQPIYEEDRVIGFQGVLTDISEIKRAEEQLEIAAALAERSRLARELHDSVTQTLYGIDLFSNATRQALSAGKTKEASENAEKIQELSKTALEDMRLLIFELQPQILEEEGLVAALQERLDLVEARTGFNTSFRVVAERSLDPSNEAELYAIATEALNNTLKHSRAEQVSVTLEYTMDSVYLTVQDDGSGFDQNNPGITKGFGLRNMEERASRLGGSFSLDSSPEAGTTVKVEVAA